MHHRPDQNVPNNPLTLFLHSAETTTRRPTPVIRSANNIFQDDIKLNKKYTTKIMFVLDEFMLSCVYRRKQDMFNKIYLICCQQWLWSESLFLDVCLDIICNQIFRKKIWQLQKKKQKNKKTIIDLSVITHFRNFSSELLFLLDATLMNYNDVNW